MKRNLKKYAYETFTFILTIMFIGQFRCFATSDKNNEVQKDPIIIQLCGDDEMENMRTSKTLLLECWYIPTSNSFLFNSFSLISNVEVTIENLTTGELIQEEYSVIAGQVSIPAISTKGTFVIELIINDNEVYIGELKL